MVVGLTYNIHTTTLSMHICLCMSCLMHLFLFLKTSLKMETTLRRVKLFCVQQQNVINKIITNAIKRKGNKGTKQIVSCHDHTNNSIQIRDKFRVRTNIKNVINNINNIFNLYIHLILQKAHTNNIRPSIFVLPFNPLHHLKNHYL